MILSGKCLSDFLVRVYYSEDTNQASDESKRKLVEHHAMKWLEKQDERFINALIIDFFDSVGIYVEVNFQINDVGEFRATSNLFYKNDYIDYISCDSRQKAIEEGIKFANKYYNKNDK